MEVGNGGTVVTEFNKFFLDYGDGNLSLSISKDETIKTGKQFSQRKDKLLSTEDKIQSFTHLVYYIEHVLQWKKQNVKTSTQRKQNVKTLNWVKEERLHKIVHYNTTERLSECFYGSYERLSNLIHLLRVVLCKLIPNLYIF